MKAGPCRPDFSATVKEYSEELQYNNGTEDKVTELLATGVAEPRKCILYFIADQHRTAALIHL